MKAKTLCTIAAIVCAIGTIGITGASLAEGFQTPYHNIANEKARWWDDAWWDDGQLPEVQNHKVVERVVSYKNGDVEVPAVVLRPDDDKQYPAVLFQHGRAGWMDLIHRHARRLAARGFVVLAPDVYAARFLDPRPIEHDYATEGDVNAGVDYLLSLPDVSTKRACLYSHTRGGYYTLKVAVTYKRQDDAVGCYVSYYPHMQDPNAPEPEQVYRYASEADALTIPAMIFIGEHEQYQRKRSIETAVKSMLDRKHDVTLITYPGVGRGFDFRPDNVRTFADDLASKDAVARAAQFMRKRLKLYAK
ncbi:dienelactone hydrolase family protein [Magnetovibrio sp.]|uniref:dienelactone hydrolase family protein n=1 Tax=Magnetovibrio sp. TaxID=2024836 RepID=UPI002F94B1D8